MLSSDWTGSASNGGFFYIGTEFAHIKIEQAAKQVWNFKFYAVY